MSNHQVKVYVDPMAIPPRFTATARKPPARLAEVDAWCQQNGFTTHILVGSGLSKAQANKIKAQQITVYSGSGHKYVRRPQF